ncbi:ipa protein [Teratosphaeria destructans]|uniref:Ipa protein n=1 Tax=Teratosphaeria destructans TaxID=418781 RepID=A0A9W7SYB7_9PEZI|nr:ipa protein [Teratosphaeria destructans]
MAWTTSNMFQSEGEMNIPELQKDLQRKYRNVGAKVEEIWRNWTPSQRGEAMREAVGDKKVLRNSRDPGLGGLRGWLPDWNLEDITATPDFFIDRLRFRVQNDLHRQLHEGANGGPGDRQVIQAVAGSVQRRGTNKDKFAAFLDLGPEYGRYLEAKGPEGRATMQSMIERSGLFLPEHEASCVIRRQTFTFVFYNHLMEEILDLDRESRGKKTPTRKAAKDTTDAMAKLNITPKPLKASNSEVIAQALEHRMASEDYLHLLRSEPVVLNDMVNTMFASRPELVPDDRGRILPLMTDKYRSIALFDVMNNAIKVIVTWDYIVDLLNAVNNSDDKVKRALILQELSNTCQVEYRRAQEAFRRQMSFTIGVAGKRFKRVTTGDHTKITLKGQPSDVTVSDPQLHYILRLCHHDTSHVAAADWIKKLDDHNSRHAEDRRRLIQSQEVALGDLAIIVSFMHTLTSSIANVAVSRKSGLLFTNRMSAIDQELNDYRAKVDLGDYVVPKDNILEPGVAASALRALSEYVTSQAGASIGSLYEDIQQQCFDDIEQMYVQAKARLEKEEQKTTYVPLPADGAPSDAVRAERRREKEKTRGQEGRLYAIEAIAQSQTESVPPAPARIKVKASVASVFNDIFKKSEARGSVDWNSFSAAMAELGFSVTPKGGSVFTFNAPDASGWGEITLHRPHGSEIEGWKLLYFARRLQRRFGWGAETFEVE